MCCCGNGWSPSSKGSMLSFSFIMAFPYRLISRDVFRHGYWKVLILYCNDLGMVRMISPAKHFWSIAKLRCQSSVMRFLVDLWALPHFHDGSVCFPNAMVWVIAATEIFVSDPLRLPSVKRAFIVRIIGFFWCRIRNAQWVRVSEFFAVSFHQFGHFDDLWAKSRIMN